MTLKEERKMVAEWLGATCHCEDRTSWWNMPDGSLMDDWNPQDNNKATFKQWSEIWKKMDNKMKDTYHKNLLLSLDIMGLETIWDVHTASPKLRWKALIKTLKEK